MTDEWATWENSPETQQAVRDRLIDWGWHTFGGEDDLGYPSHTNFANPPKPDYRRHHPEHGPDDAWAVEYMITSAAQASLESMTNAIVLRTEFVRRDLTQAEKARRLSMSRRTYKRRVNRAMFWFWRLAKHPGIEEAAVEWAKRA